MSVRFRKPKRVVITPIRLFLMCHNKYCRKPMMMGERIKYLTGLAPGYNAPICLQCSILVNEKGFEYEGKHYASPMRR